MNKIIQKITICAVLTTALIAQPAEAMNRKPNWLRIGMVGVGILGAGYLAYKYLTEPSTQQDDIKKNLETTETNLKNIEQRSEQERIQEEKRIEEEKKNKIFNDYDELMRIKNEELLQKENEHKKIEEQRHEEKQTYYVTNKKTLADETQVKDSKQVSMQIFDTRSHDCEPESDDFFNNTAGKEIFKVWSKVQNVSLDQKELKILFKSVFNNYFRHKAFSRFGIINNKLVGLMIVKDNFAHNVNTLYTAEIIATSRKYAQELFNSFLLKITDVPKNVIPSTGELIPFNETVEKNKKDEDYAIFKFWIIGIGMN